MNLRSAQSKSLQERLIDEAKTLREEAQLLPPGAVRDATIRAARDAEFALHLEDWANSSGLRPPK